MRLTKAIEWIVFFPAVLFGRHVLPILVVSISLFIDFRIGIYIALCWSCFVLLLYSSVLTVLFTEPLKYLFSRERPELNDITNRVVPLRNDLKNPAFPSGDSAQVVYLYWFEVRLL